MSNEEPIYCHKCKRRTENKNVLTVQTSNGLWRLAAECKICDGKKSKFIKSPIAVVTHEPRSKQVNEEMKIQEAKELHKDYHKKFKKRRIITLGIDDLWAADLIIMRSYAKENNGYQNILIVEDTFSKFVWGEPLKRKNGVETTEAFERIMNKAKMVGHNPPRLLHTDKGLEFKNGIFMNMLKKYNIKLYHTENVEKSAIVERFNRTLNNKMKISFQVQNNHKWVENLQKWLEEYNYKDYHRTIKMAPAEVSKANEELILKQLNKYNTPTVERPKFKIGDRVRITRYKNTFANKYEHKWTQEIFVITQVQPTNPITYKLKDLNNEEIQGSFYKYELQSTSF